MELVRARLGDDLDAPVPGPVVLCRKGVLIDADCQDGGLGGQLTAGEAIDINLAAVRTHRGTCERRQFAGQLVRIVGKCIQRITADHRGALVTIRVYVELNRIRGDIHRLRGVLQPHRHVRVHVRTRGHDNPRFDKRGKARRNHAHRIRARGQPAKRVSAVALRGRRLRLAGRGRQGHRRGRNQRVIWIDNHAMYRGASHRSLLRNRGKRQRSDQKK